MTAIRYIFYVACIAIIGTYVVAAVTGHIQPPAELVGLQ